MNVVKTRDAVHSSKAKRRVLLSVLIVFWQNHVVHHKISKTKLCIK